MNLYKNILLWLMVLLLAIGTSCDDKNSSSNWDNGQVTTAPVIVTQPQRYVTKNLGDAVTFSVGATGATPLTYEWHKDGSLVATGNAASYTVEQMAQTDLGDYFCIVSNNAGTATSQPGTLATPFYAPSPIRIAFTSARSLAQGYLVSNPIERSVRIYDLAGNLTGKFTVDGEPLGVAAKTNGEILVGNKTQQRIDVYNEQGNYLRCFGAVTVPNDIAVSEAQSRIFVTDSQESVIKVFHLAGENLLSTIGTSGTGNGQLSWPTGVAVDETNQRIVVGDFGNQRLQLFDLSGNFLSTITHKPADTAWFVRPEGIAVDAAGLIYAVDSLWNGVYIFDAAGTLQKIIGEFGMDPGQLQNPGGLVLLSDGSMVVCDLRNKRLTTFTAAEIARAPKVAAYQQMAEEPKLPENQRAAHQRTDGFHFLNDNTGTPAYIGFRDNGCLDCHKSHMSSNTNGPLLDPAKDTGNFCNACHKLGGPGDASVDIHSKSTWSSYPAFSITCKVCHQPHRQDALPNIKNIRKTIEYPADVTNDVTFLSNLDYAKGLSGSTSWGPCKVCHSNAGMLYHKRTDAAYSDHFMKKWSTADAIPGSCSACHRHQNSVAGGGFQYERSAGLTKQMCADCHNTVQTSIFPAVGSRRDIIPATADKGRHGFSALTDPVAPAAFAYNISLRCLVCHDISQHREGKVRLKNPDDATQVFSFTKFNIPTSFTFTVSGNTLTTSAAHGFTVGTEVRVRNTPTLTISAVAGNTLTTSAAHGLAVNNAVTLANIPGTTYTISAVAGNTLTTSAAHTFAVNTPVKFHNPVPTPLVSATTYYVQSVSGTPTTQFTVSATPGPGPVFTLTSTQIGGKVAANDVPAPLVTGTTYYVQSVPLTTTFTLSATSGGPVLPLTSLNGGTSYVGYLPVPLLPDTTYYVQSIPLATTLTLSATSGGPVLPLTNAGNGTHTIFGPGMGRNGTPPTGESTQNQVMTNICLKCHDAGGAADQENYQIVSASATPSTPFQETPTPFSALDVDSKVATSNSFYHPINGYHNLYSNNTTLVAAYAVFKRTGQTLNCWDCHLMRGAVSPATEVDGHGGLYSLMVDRELDPNNPTGSSTVRTAHEGFCTKCHVSTSYVSASTGSRFTAHNRSDHRPTSATYGFGCRLCHAGLFRKGTMTWDTGARYNSADTTGTFRPGMIHGGTFLWPAAAPNADNTPSYDFMIGGAWSGWQAATSATQNSCWTNTSCYGSHNPRTY
jgi:predicted CXXCH cytochrome family protein